MDAGFKSRAFPAMTTEGLRIAIGAGRGSAAMIAERDRRVAVDAGDASQASDGDKLHGRVGKRVLKENGGEA
jgi:hypothetical protein